MATKELQAIIAARAAGQRAALVTVVRTTGSTYRRAGARMLILDNGDAFGTDFLGSISGGCLEDDAREHALIAIRTHRPARVRYDTTAESDIVFGTGAGCRGTVEVFIEPLPASDAAPDPLACIARAMRERRSGALASIIAADSTLPAVLGAFLWIDGPGREPSATVTTILDPALAAAVAADARAAALQGWTGMRSYPLAGHGHAEVFINALRPPRALLICGAGQDALPLARQGKELGWRVRVADGRRAYLSAARFPDADALIHCPAPEFGARVDVEPEEAVVLMTHNYLHDLDILRALLLSPAGYIGVLGPRQRTERLLGDLSADRLDLDKFSLRRLHGPAGLDIGAEAPEQIALSIIAEIEAFAAGREGGMLKHRRTPLHQL